MGRAPFSHLRENSTAPLFNGVLVRGWGSLALYTAQAHELEINNYGRLNLKRYFSAGLTIDREIGSAEDVCLIGQLIHTLLEIAVSTPGGDLEMEREKLYLAISRFFVPSRF